MMSRVSAFALAAAVLCCVAPGVAAQPTQMEISVFRVNETGEVLRIPTGAFYLLGSSNNVVTARDRILVEYLAETFPSLELTPSFQYDNETYTVGVVYDFSSDRVSNILMGPIDSLLLTSILSTNPLTIEVGFFGRSTPLTLIQQETVTPVVDFLAPYDETLPTQFFEGSVFTNVPPFPQQPLNQAPPFELISDLAVSRVHFGRPTGIFSDVLMIVSSFPVQNVPLTSYELCFFRWGTCLGNVFDEVTTTPVPALDPCASSSDDGSSADPSTTSNSLQSSTTPWQLFALAPFVGYAILKHVV